jgi:uncharacterized cupredoxin-like copper-binding protein
MNARSKAVGLTLCTLVLGGALTFVACSDPNDISTVNVTLREFSVSLDQRTVPQGQVTFHVTNAGTVPHEFLVIQTDLGPDALPTDSEGAYRENASGTDLIDELEDIDPGQSRDLTIDLDDARYVLICNMVHREGGTVSAHYSLGMRTSFQVN